MLDIISSMCDQLLLKIKEQNHEAIIIYYNQIVKQVISTLELRIEFNSKSLNDILQSVKGIAEYTKQNIQLPNIGFLLNLQNDLSLPIYKIDSDDRESLEEIKSVVNQNIGFLKGKGIEAKGGIKFTLADIKPESLLDSIRHNAEALNTAKDPIKIEEISSDLDRGLKKYVWIQAHTILDDCLERRTLESQARECPRLFVERVKKCLNLLEILNPSVGANDFKKRFLYNMGNIVKLAKDKKTSPTGNNYLFSLDELNNLVVELSELLLKSDSLEFNQTKEIISWREDRSKFYDILSLEYSTEDILDKQRFLSSNIQTMLSDMIKRGEEILGSPPCGYAVLSLGSISRSECFPRSDLEFLIILDGNKPFQKQYFVHLAKLLEVQITALGASKSGFGLDGNDAATDPDHYIIPLDRLEEIYFKEQKNKADEQEIESILKEPLEVSSYSLLKPLWLYGNDLSLFDKYKKKISSIIRESYKEEAILQLRAHIDSYLEKANVLQFMNLGVEEVDKKDKSINIKECLYSPLVYLAIDLGLYYNIEAQNTLEIYKELNNRGIIPNKVFIALKEAFSEIVALRFKVHNAGHLDRDTMFIGSLKRNQFNLSKGDFEKLKSIYHEVLRPLYKALEIIVSGQKAEIGYLEEIALNYYKARIKKEDKIQNILDDKIILYELLGILHEQYRFDYSLKEITQTEPAKQAPIVKIIFTDLGERYLKPKVAKQLFNIKGEFIADKLLSGTHKVKFIKYGRCNLHIKFSPELPGVEKGVEILSQLLVGAGTTSLSEFVRCEVNTDQQKLVYPLLLSQTILGATAEEALLQHKVESESEFDERELTKSAIAAAITRQEDGHFRNYIVENIGGNKHRIVCIDKDHGFIEAVIKENNKPILMFTCIIFCLQQAQEFMLNSIVMQDIKRLDIDIMLQRWLEELERLNRHILNIWSEKEIKKWNQESAGFLPRFFTWQTNTERSVIPIIIGNKSLGEAYELLWQLQDMLNHQISGVKYFSLLRIMHPLVHKIYEKLSEEYSSTPIEFFNKLTNGKTEFFKPGAKSPVNSRAAQFLDSRLTIDQRVKSVAGKLLTYQDMKNQPDLTPQGALEELNKIKPWKDSMTLVKQEFKNGRFSFYKKLLPVHREALINDLDAKEYEGGDKILQLLKEYKTNFKRLVFRNYSTLDDNTLFWYLNYNDLNSLVLSGVPKINGNCFNDGLFLSGLPGYAQLLEKLIVEKMDNLRTLGTENSSLIFDNLRRLEIRQCTSLETININAHRLDEFELQAQSSRLSRLIIKTKQNAKNFNILDDLSRVNIKGCYVDGQEICTYKTGVLKLIYANALASNKEGIKALVVANKRKISEINLSLTSLDFSNNWLGEEDGIAIGKALGTNTTLTSLDFSNNWLGEEGWIAIGKALEINSTLTSLRLNGELRKIGGLAIAKALEINSTLTSLRLNGELRGIVGLAIVALEMFNGELREKGGLAIVEALKTNSTLTSLNLESNNLGEEGGRAIGKALETNSTLASLNLESNNLGEEGGRAIGKALETNSTLASLNLKSNNLREEGGRAIAKALETNATLTFLNLESNNLRDKGGRAIGKALKANTTLTYLYLYLNNLGEEGGVAIAKALEANTTLTSLDLNYNRLREEGGVAIAKALETNTTLTSLYLYLNNLGEKGGKAVGDALQTNTTLTSLDLSYNRIREEGGVAIAKALETNSTLTSLDLTCNCISNLVLKNIESYAVRNRTCRDANAANKNKNKEQLPTNHLPSNFYYIIHLIGQSLRFAQQNPSSINYSLPISNQANYFSYLDVNVMTRIASYIPINKIREGAIIDMIQEITNKKWISRERLDEFLSSNLQENSQAKERGI